MKYIKWVMMTAAVICMVMATIHYEQPDRNEGITWFWGAWSIAFGWWAIDAARRRNAVFFLAFAAMLMGMDSIRGRLDLFPDLIDPAGNGSSVWFVRIAMGWVAVIYIATRSRSVSGDNLHVAEVRLADSNERIADATEALVEQGTPS